MLFHITYILSKLQDKMLFEAVESLFGISDSTSTQIINWSKVEEIIGGWRSSLQCKNRWNKNLKYRKEDYKTVPWTTDEVCMYLRISI
jgi:hypothetical protein